ncbi:MAG: hypothetical protein HY508_03430 [Acidobacteria bacterium]|nr:hypothetical protein [Acidobacteriota bacterium]
MGKYDLGIVLDRPEATFVPGERITGRVEVDVHEDCQCKGLWVDCVWKASGGGIGDAGKVGQQNLFAGLWRAGQEARYPFEFIAPPGPLSYDGKRFVIHWHLSASALVSLINPVIEERFHLVAGEPPEESRRGQARLAPQPYRHAVKVEGTGGGGLTTVLSVAALLLGVPAFFLGLQDVLPWFVPVRIPFPLPRLMPFGVLPILTLVAGIFLTSLGWRGVRRNIRPAVAGTKLGPVEVELSSDVARPGHTITCALRFQPRAQVDLTEATARLVATEHTRVETGSGDDTRYQNEQEVVSEIPTTLSRERSIAPGEGVLLHARLNLPASAPYSFVGNYNKLLWTVGLELKLRGWPDWTFHMPLVVRP